MNLSLEWLNLLAARMIHSFVTHTHLISNLCTFVRFVLLKYQLVIKCRTCFSLLYTSGAARRGTCGFPNVYLHFLLNPRAADKGLFLLVEFLTSENPFKVYFDCLKRNWNVLINLCRISKSGSMDQLYILFCAKSEGWR